MSNSKRAATYYPNVPPVCGDEWRDMACPFSAGAMVHVCVREPRHVGVHECSCGSRVEE